MADKRTDRAHTPGPWQIKHRDPLQVCDSDGVERGCSPICGMLGPGTAAEKQANARLVASAPDLLSALQGMFALHEPEGRFQPHHYKAPLRAAREALLKATGIDNSRQVYREAQDAVSRDLLLLDALRALHKNMLAQDAENQAERPTEDDYQRCMRNAALAIAKGTGGGPC